MFDHLVFKKELLDVFTAKVKEKFPKKTFGFFLSKTKNGDPCDFVILNNDQRNDWKGLFESYGNYYKINEDAGFLASPEETYKAEKKIREKGLFKVGLFHSHQRHPAIFAQIDADLHPEKDLWHLIISLRNIESPQIKVFSLRNPNITEIKMHLS